MPLCENRRHVVVAEFIPHPRGQKESPQADYEGKGNTRDKLSKKEGKRQYAQKDGHDLRD